MPPSRAIAMAIRLSVTVSMAALTSGALRLISRVSRVVVSMSAGARSENPGQQQDVVVGEAEGGELLRQLFRDAVMGAGHRPQSTGVPIHFRAR